MDATSIIRAVLATAKELELTANSPAEYHVVRVLEKLAAKLQEQDNIDTMLSQE